jgi:hypothetical protein
MSSPRLAVAAWAAALAAATAAVTATVTATASASAARPAARDWEASGRGQAQASLLETRAAGSGRRLQDLVVQAPVTCADSPTPTLPIDVQVIGGSIPVRTGGAFSRGTLRHGSGTALSGRLASGHLTLTYRHVWRSRNQFDGGTQVCDTKTVRLAGAPGHRPTLADRTWRGTTATHKPVAVNVVAGGRALEAPARPSADGQQSAISFGQFEPSCGNGACSRDICAYETPVTLFVGPDGSFGNAAWQEGDQAVFTGRFTGPRAVRGTFTNGAEGCAQTSWTGGP